MSRAKTAFALLVVFFAGCAAERFLPTLVVPPARAGTSPQRWEYACTDAYFPIGDVAKRANEFGQQGWEMTGAAAYEFTGGTQGVIWCFKRPLP